MQTKIGTATVFNHYPDKYMWAGGGDRSVKKTIRFEGQKFETAPKVVASISGFISYHGTDARIKVDAIDITTLSFVVEVSTSVDTQLASVDIAWVAVSN